MSASHVHPSDTVPSGSACCDQSTTVVNDASVASASAYPVMATTTTTTQQTGGYYQAGGADTHLTHHAKKSHHKHGRTHAHGAHPAGGVVQAVQSGHAPSTSEIAGSLVQAQRTIEHEQQPNTKYGKRAVNDVHTVLGHASQLLQEKNHDDLFQQLIEHIRLAGEEAKHRAHGAGRGAADVKADVASLASGGKTRIVRRTRDVHQSLKHLAMTLVQNGDFRALLIDFVDLFQDMVEQSLSRIQSHQPMRALAPLNQLATERGPVYKEQAKDMLNQGQQVTQQLGQQARELANKEGQQINELRSGLTSQATDLTSRVGGQINQQTQQLQSTARDLSAEARQVGSEAQQLASNATASVKAEASAYNQPSGALFTPAYDLPAQNTVTVQPIQAMAITTEYGAFSAPTTEVTTATFVPVDVTSTTFGGGSLSSAPASGAAASLSAAVEANKPMAQQTAQHAKDTAYHAKDAARGAMLDTKNTASEIKSDAMATGQKMMADTKQVSATITQDTKQFAGEARREVREVAHDIQSQTRNVAREIQGAARETGQMSKQVGREILQDFKQGGIPIDAAKRQQLLNRFFSLWNQVLNNPDFQKAIEAIFDISDEFRGSMSQLTGYVKAQAAGTQLPKLTYGDQVWMDVREIISRWTGHEQLDLFLADLNEWFALLRSDAETSQLMFDIRSHIEETIEQPGLLKQEDRQNQAAELIDRLLMQFQRWTHGSETTYVLNEFRALLQSIKYDPTSRQFNQAAEQLGRDLILDERGHVNFKVTQDVLDSMKSIVVPIMLDQFAMVPLPKIESSDENMDLCIENLHFPGSALLPENVEFKSKQYMKMARGNRRSTASAKIKLAINNIKADIRDIKFSFAKKTGAIKMHDNGVMNVAFGGPAAHVAITWNMHTTNHTIRFETSKVVVHLDHLKIDFVEAHHHVLLPMVAKLGNGIIKKRIEAEAAKAIQSKLNNINARLNAIALDAARKEHQLEHGAAKLRDRASAGTEAAAHTVSTKAHMATAATGHALHNAAHTVNRAFQPGKGQNLKERAQYAYGIAQSKVDHAQTTLQNAKNKAQAQTGALHFTDASSAQSSSMLPAQPALLSAPIGIQQTTAFVYTPLPADQIALQSGLPSSMPSAASALSADRASASSTSEGNLLGSGFRSLDINSSSAATSSASDNLMDAPLSSSLTAAPLQPIDPNLATKQREQEANQQYTGSYLGQAM